MSCLCGHSWCWRCGNNASEPNHDIKCFIGKDVWNVKIFIIICLIFGPVLVYFLPALFVIVTFDILNEDDDTIWILRNRKYFYPILIVFSPLIEVLGIFMFVIGMSCVLAEKVYKQIKWLCMPAYIIGVFLFTCVGVIGIAGAVVFSFFACVAGIFLLVVRYIGKLVGKERKEPSFYPQVFE